MVGVCIVAYNQEEYIAQAIDSVLMQENCKEDIHIYIGNDCSTDRTTIICEEYSKHYPNRITLLNHSRNLGLVDNTIQVLTKIKKDNCDYIAMLDGDDYWIDSNKIKKQIDFLDINPNVGFVHTNIFCLTDSKLRPSYSSNIIPPCGKVFKEMGRFSIGNCSVLFKSSLLDKLDLNELASEGFLSLDGVMYTIFSSITEFGYLPDITAVWRRGHSSVSNTNDEQKQIAYLENERIMWSYLDRKFSGIYGYNEDSWQHYRNLKVFNIAFAYNDYPLAHFLSAQINVGWNPKLIAKRICAKNRFLFKFWGYMKRRKATSS